MKRKANRDETKRIRKDQAHPSSTAPKSSPLPAARPIPPEQVLEQQWLFEDLELYIQTGPQEPGDNQLAQCQ